MTADSLIRVIAATDHTANSDAAIRWATSLSRSMDIHLTVTTAYHEPRTSLPEESAFQHLEAVRQQLVTESAPVAAVGVHHSVLPIEGDAADVLNTLSTPDSLLVLGRTHEGDAGVGPLGQWLTHHLNGPVAVVPGPTRLPMTTIVIGVDGSKANDVALHWAANLARRSKCRLVAVYGDHPLLNDDLPGRRSRNTVDVGERVAGEHVEAIAHPELDLHFATYRAKPGDALRLAVEHFSAGAVIVGTRGLGGFHGRVLGSVPVDLLNNPPCPVIVVPH